MRAFNYTTPRDLYRNEFIQRVRAAGFSFDGVFIRGDDLATPMRLADFEARYKYRAIFDMLRECSKALVVVFLVTLAG